MSEHLREGWGRQVVGVSIPDLPDAGMFDRGSDHLDPRVFDGDRLKSEMRAAIIETLDGYWGPLYGNWQRWAMVYVAGSAASYWWSSDTDLDILIGVDMTELRRQRPQNIGVSEEEVCAHLDHGLKTDLDPLTTNFRGTGMTATFFCNPGSFDIRVIKPYAAYNVTTDTWAVHPPILPEDWGAKYFPMDWWRRAATIAGRIAEILEEPEPERTELGVSLFDAMHAQRNKAYSPLGFGWTDWGNFNWQVQSQWHMLQPLYRLKHPELAATASLSFAREGTVEAEGQCEYPMCRRLATVTIGNEHYCRIHADEILKHRRQAADEIDYELCDRIIEALEAAGPEGLTTSQVRRKTKATTSAAMKALDWMVAQQYIHTSGNGAWTHYHAGRRR